MKSIILSSSVTAIAARAFFDCTGLTSFTIPKSITSIAVKAFNGCTSLSSIYVYGAIPIALSSTDYVFYDVNPNTCILHVSYGSTALYAASIQWNSFKNIVEMPGFGLSKYNLSLAATGTTASVDVVSNVTWTISCNESWLTVSPTSASGNNILTINLQTNPSVATRTALLTISSPGIVSQTLKVTQIGLPKTLAVTAGGLSSALTAEELSTSTKIILTGTIDARDFRTMRDLMPLLSELDLSGATIAAYYGIEGTVHNSNYQYLENTVSEGAFYGKRSLKSAILPLSLTAIQNYAFTDCSGLTSVTAPSSVTLIDQYAFRNCSGLTSFDMPSSLTTFGMAAFENCSLLTSITIPSSVTYIGDNAFSGCNSLTSIYAYGVIPVYRADDWNIFTVGNISCKLYVPYGTSVLYAAVSPWKHYVNMVEMPGFNLSSYKVSFPTSESAAKVAINANVPWTATSDASWLTVSPVSFNGNDSITISAQTNPSIAARTASVTISAAGVVPQVLTVMQVGNLKMLQVTAGGLYAALTPIERQTIYNLRLTGTIDASDFKTMRDRMPSLTQLDISGTSIVPYSGSDGTFNSNHDYPANTVPIYAFLNLDTQLGKTSLISVVLPSSTTTIDGWAFYGCTGLTNITLPSALSIIGSHAFHSCTGLNSLALALPPSLTNIGSNAFQNCTGLNSFTIPSSVTTIDSWAFSYCKSLTSIYTLRVTPVNLSSSNNVFSMINKTTCILHVPYGSSALYKAADQWKDFLNIVEMPGAGSIATNQTICAGMIPAPLTSKVAGAGQGTISYRWEYSHDDISWFPTGTSAETYAPGALTQTTKFRRITLSTVNGISWESMPTEPVTISTTLNSTITLSSAVGTDAQTLCANTAIKNITYITAGATGAVFSGLPDGVNGTLTSNMVIISGIPSTSGTFNYTVTLSGCGVTTITGSIVVNMDPPTVSISVNQNNVSPGTPVTFTAIPVNGGNTPNYRWYLNNVAVASGPGGTYVPKNGDVVYVVMTSSLPNVTGSPATSNVVTMVVGTSATQPAYFTEGKAFVTPGLSNVRYTVPNVADVTYIWSYSGTGQPFQVHLIQY